ncbi:MAG: lactate utilization protein [Betaproteobacteria bacterium]|nr:lactate utilization protein [Betaproteobacteria bacterium]
MQVTSMHFKATASRKLRDANLQAALRKLQGNFVRGRAERVRELDNFEAIRDAAAEIRDRALAHLDVYLEEFERLATARGAIVHWAETHEDVARIVCGIARAHGVKKAVKSKSMVSEECALNDALEAAGIEVVETDLGEYILQLAKEPPSHIVAPVVHKTRDEALAHLDVYLEEFERLATARGAIVHWAETHEDVATLMRLLRPHGTGQTISNYVSVTTGVKGADDADGPESFHVILVDAGRTQLIGGEMQAMLRCIRCGACMNHCPVYQSVGGHAYGWVYPGPMGAVLTPTYVGLENALDLPNAATFCNQCGVVCPVKIPLPDLMRKLRERQFERKLKPWTERAALALWSWAAQRPVIYAMMAAFGSRALAWMGGARKRIRTLPFGGGWTDGRDLPAPQGRTFRELHCPGRPGASRNRA